ncbi:hypothetical protein JSO56_05755 [Riemerella anatipestifer]|uniref:hypothetical protein n=1 Tax=Riemerella anatipestifer TaxID=34085 RepID=UPI0030C3A35B
MKLIEITESLRNNTINRLIEKYFITIEYDLIDVYAINSLGLESEYYFFNAEEVSGVRIFEEKGVKYENLCPLSMLKDLVSDFTNQNPYILDLELAKQILDYIENDA